MSGDPGGVGPPWCTLTTPRPLNVLVGITVQRRRGQGHVTLGSVTTIQRHPLLLLLLLLLLLIRHVTIATTRTEAAIEQIHVTVVVGCCCCWLFRLEHQSEVALGVEVVVGVEEVETSSGRPYSCPAAAYCSTGSSGPT